jgi:spore coat polysaccharide biosynthesis protein SpsF
MTGIILQARMGSTRLPGKIFKAIGNKTLLAWIAWRLGFLKHKVLLVVATSVAPENDKVREFCVQNKIECFSGSESNVLERYYYCARQYGFDSIVRMTGDNPFPDIEELDNLIGLYETSGADYCNSYKSLPIGVGAEIFSFAALEDSFRKGKEPHHLEHVDEYILEHPELFRTLELKTSSEKNWPDIRLTVDTPEDYKRACYIAEHAAGEMVSTPEAIRLCSDFA